MDRINKNHALQKKAVSPNFETDTHKIVRVAYDDEGTNMFVLVDKKNKEIVSYSISGNSERDKFTKLQENKMESRKIKLLENFIRKEVRKSLHESNSNEKIAR